MMRSTMFLFLALLWLAGCASKPAEPGAAAEDKEVIEESIVTTVDPDALKCPSGTTKWCVRKVRDEECRCVSDSEGRAVIETRPTRSRSIRKPR